MNTPSEHAVRAQGRSVALAAWGGLVLELLMAGCATGGHAIVSGAPAPVPSNADHVVLYGIESRGAPPAGCRVLGTVRAWSIGEKTFPYAELRSGAACLGGNAAFDIRPDPGAVDPRRPTHLATVARCP